MKMHVARFMISLSLVGVIFAAACERTVTRVEQVHTASTCFNCHTDQDLFLVAASEQWARSTHASGNNIDRNTPPCNECHTHEGYLAKLAGETLDEAENPNAIHCFTCHAPHSNDTLEPRVTDPPALQNGEVYDLTRANICIDCHQSRRDVTAYLTPPVNLSPFWGPHHGPQSDILIGTNGYEYASFTYDNTNHRSAIDGGCMGCHFDKTSNFILGGHSFNMEWDDGSGATLNTDACLPCHTVTDWDHNGRQTEVDGLAANLLNLLVNAGLMMPDGRPASVTVNDADSAGAVWNYMMYKEDQSSGVHNYKYTRDLLESAIQFMGGSPAPPVAEEQRPSGVSAGAGAGGTR